MMFLCLPIIFIISISDTRSDRSFSVASSENTRVYTQGRMEVRKTSPPRRRLPLLFFRPRLQDDPSLLNEARMTNWAKLTEPTEATQQSVSTRRREKRQKRGKIRILGVNAVFLVFICFRFCLYGFSNFYSFQNI